MSGTERVHQLGILVRRRDALSDGLRRGPGQLRGPERHEPDVRGRAWRYGGGAVHGHRGHGGGVSAVQGQPVTTGRGQSAVRVPEGGGRRRPDDDVRGQPSALRQTVYGTEWRRCRYWQLAGQTVPVIFRRFVPGVQAGQHVLTKRRRRQHRYRRRRRRRWWTPPIRDDRLSYAHRSNLTR